MDWRLGICAGIQHELYQHQHRLGQSILSAAELLEWRVVGTWRISPRVSAAARVPSAALSPAVKRETNSPRAAGQAGNKSAGGTSKANAERQHLRAACK